MVWPLNYNQLRWVSSSSQTVGIFCRLSVVSENGNAICLLYIFTSPHVLQRDKQWLALQKKPPMWHSGNKSFKNIAFCRIRSFFIFCKRYVKSLKYVIFLKRANMSFYIFTYLSWVQKYGTFIEYFNLCATLNWMVKEFRIQFHVVLILSSCSQQERKWVLFSYLSRDTKNDPMK